MRTRVEILVPDHTRVLCPNKIGPRRGLGGFRSAACTSRRPRYEIRLIVRSPPILRVQRGQRGRARGVRVGKGRWLDVGLALAPTAAGTTAPTHSWRNILPLGLVGVARYRLINPVAFGGRCTRRRRCSRSHMPNMLAPRALQPGASPPLVLTGFMRRNTGRLDECSLPNT